MLNVLHDLLQTQALASPTKNAVGVNGHWLSYQTLSANCMYMSHALLHIGISSQQRVAVYLPKTIEAIVSYFSTSMAGGIFVPINPILKAPQVSHILSNCSATLLITNAARLNQLPIDTLNELANIIIIDSKNDVTRTHDITATIWHWSDLITAQHSASLPVVIDTDIAAIFYTSGSTGQAKGVVLSHQNMVMGAKSVAQYLPCSSTDVMLALQPLSFDYGFSQLTIALLVGASCYLLDYVFPQDVFTTIAQQKITTLALVPPLWVKLAQQNWPNGIGSQIRYFCNTGGAMPTTTLELLLEKMPNAAPYLMYGLTEAFRSCYLPPEEIATRPSSFGKAIPNEKISVINEQGQECAPFEPGELVHQGALVAQGYWNDAKRTQERFKPAPNALAQVPSTRMAVWSGDIVEKDEQGFLYFIGRKDDMIKTSGYRVSPAEVEQQLFNMPCIEEAIVFGIPHPILGQAIAAVVKTAAQLTVADIQYYCRQHMANYMVPTVVEFSENLPRNGNGKFDRNYWQQKLNTMFINTAEQQ